MRWCSSIAALLGACSAAPTPPSAPAGPPASMVATAASGDVQVASVTLGGITRPVWGSCVTAQTARGATAADATHQCIDFELMSIAAEQRGLGLDPDVYLATKTALVSGVVATEYEDKFTRPEDFGPYWTRSLDRNRARFDHPEVRGSVYVRIELPTKATPAEETSGKQLIDELYAALANETGLMKPQLEDIAHRVIGSRGALKLATAPSDIRHGSLDDGYAAALFSISDIGRVSSPVRTPWGWDIVMWDSVVPEIHAKPDEIVRAALPDIKRAYFAVWVARVAQNLGIKPQVFEANLSSLEAP